MGKTKSRVKFFEEDGSALYADHNTALLDTTQSSARRALRMVASPRFHIFAVVLVLTLCAVSTENVIHLTAGATPSAAVRAAQTFSSITAKDAVHHAQQLLARF
uniref:Uncharacterized protein n=1 Tax=Erythrolobus australicus TaxID=1077150 RepID=A0A7S1TLJ1_9RHOD|mmetsp:Transcript_3937/g.10820  ORF Transcript_3937/g.10820 Transcript_3937/m.10820 type:complete len:104 (+) Transcript_3937:123-434(+)